MQIRHVRPRCKVRFGEPRRPSSSTRQHSTTTTQQHTQHNTQNTHHNTPQNTRTHTHLHTSTLPTMLSCKSTTTTMTTTMMMMIMMMMTAMMVMVFLPHQAFVQASSCNIYSDCTNCTSHTALNGVCRWCPLTNSCHDPGSLYNKCPSAQNIVGPFQCTAGEYVQPIYDEAVARRSLLFASASYSDDPQQCINHTQLPFHVYRRYTAPCSPEACVAYLAFSEEHSESKSSLGWSVCL